MVNFMEKVCLLVRFQLLVSLLLIMSVDLSSLTKLSKIELLFLQYLHGDLKVRQCYFHINNVCYYIKDVSVPQNC